MIKMILETGDIFKTSSGDLRLIIGGNRSYGITSYYTVDPFTFQIKSRNCSTINELLRGYSIIAYAKGGDIDLIINVMNELKQPDVEDEDDEVVVTNDEIADIIDDGGLYSSLEGDYDDEDYEDDDDCDDDEDMFGNIF